MIGLIVNPSSSKDIRRLVALGRVVTVDEKANLVARFLAGLRANPTVEVKALDDSAGIVRRAIRMAGAQGAEVSWIDVPVDGSESDTIAAAATFGAEGADLLVIVGGDGTLRAAVHGWPQAPLLMLPAGTNNAFASVVEPTVAGLAASHIMDPGVAAASLTSRPRLVVEGPESSDTSVVDAVGLRDHWLASRAIWRPSELVEAVVTRADPSTIGVAAVAAAFGPLDSTHVRYLRFGHGRQVRAAFGPGLLATFSIAETRDVPVGTDIVLDTQTTVVALDGERRVLGGHPLMVRARWGPSAFSPRAALAQVYEGT